MKDDDKVILRLQLTPGLHRLVRAYASVTETGPSILVENLLATFISAEAAKLPSEKVALINALVTQYQEHDQATIDHPDYVPPDLRAKLRQEADRIRP